MEELFLNVRSEKRSSMEALPSEFIKHNSDLNNELSVLSSEDEFKKRIKAISDAIDSPSLVDEEINYQKERLSKLKFQYIEQETKEKFLRFIVEKPDLLVNKEDINQLEQNNLTVKAYLKTLKETANKKSTDIDKLTEEIINLKENYDSSYDEVSNLLRETEEIDNHLGRALNNMTNEKEEIMRTLRDLPLDVFDGEREKLITNASYKLVETDEELVRTQDELQSGIRNKHHEEQTLEELKRLMEFLELAVKEEDSKSHPNEQQYYAQWLSELKYIFSRLLSD